jgi:inner membrane protein
MPSPVSHATVALALGSLFPHTVLPRQLWLLGVCCAALPDVDIISFRLGIEYHHVLGHRGLTHSISFALGMGLVAAGVTFFIVKGRGLAIMLGLYLFVCTLSHGLLDAMTNGGSGVAFFAPFLNERFFLSWRPIDVAPLSMARFFTASGMQVIGSELMWVALPSLLVALFATAAREESGRPHPKQTNSAFY